MIRRTLSAVVFLWLLASPLHVSAAAPPHTWLFYIGGVGTTVLQSDADFGMLFQALKAVAPPGDWTMADLSYNGDGIDADGNPVPSLYSPCDTLRDVGMTAGIMVRSLASFQARHPDDRIVLVGHSLGGLFAYYMVAAAPFLRIAANVSIDAPLHGVSGWDWLASPSGCTPVDGGALDEMAQDGHTVASVIMKELTAAYNAGPTSRNVGIVANEADCAYDLSLSNCPFFGSDWRFTMYAPADWTATYDDPVRGVGTMTQEISVPHSAILHNFTAMEDVVRFLDR